MDVVRTIEDILQELERLRRFEAQVRAERKPSFSKMEDQEGAPLPEPSDPQREKEAEDAKDENETLQERLLVLEASMAEASEKIKTLESQDEGVGDLQNTIQDLGELKAQVESLRGSVGQTSRKREIQWEILSKDTSSEVLVGKLTNAFSTGATVTIDPCDIHGTDNGLANITGVYVQASRASYSMHNSTTIPTTEIVHYALGDDGEYYLLGSPRIVLVDFMVDITNRQFLLKHQDTWGAFSGTVSDWVVAHTGSAC